MGRTYIVKVVCRCCNHGDYMRTKRGSIVEFNDIKSAYRAINIFKEKKKDKYIYKVISI